MSNIVTYRYCIRCSKKKALADFKKPYICNDCAKYKDKKPLRKKDTHSTNLRIAAILEMGGACSSCGFSDIRALQIDHKNGGGSQERKKTSQYALYKKVYNLAIKGECKDYQVLCANCNWIKRHENHESKNQFMI